MDRVPSFRVIDEVDCSVRSMRPPEKLAFGRFSRGGDTSPRLPTESELGNEFKTIPEPPVLPARILTFETAEEVALRETTEAAVRRRRQVTALFGVALIALVIFGSGTGENECEKMRKLTIPFHETVAASTAACIVTPHPLDFPHRIVEIGIDHAVGSIVYPVRVQVFDSSDNVCPAAAAAPLNVMGVNVLENFLHTQYIVLLPRTWAPHIYVDYAIAKGHYVKVYLVNTDPQTSFEVWICVVLEREIQETNVG